MSDLDLYKDEAGEWRWRLQAKNGRIIADSAEGYHNKIDAVHGYNLFVESAGQASIEVEDVLEEEEDGKG